MAVSKPSAAAPSVEDVLGPNVIAAILGLHPRTIQRRSTSPVRSALQAEREKKLHEIWSELLTSYSPENAIRWLNSEVPALGFRLPLSVMAEDGGLDRVLQTVGRMSWGIPD